MYSGKLVFAQVMDHLPMHTFRQAVRRYGGDRYVKSFPCHSQFLCMAFAQLTYRESLRDIEVCMRAQRRKLYHLGIRNTVSRNTLANANKQRDWRIYAEVAQELIRIARPMYADEDLGLDLDNTVFALDASTIDLCLSVFPWAPFRSTKAAVKLHTLLDLRGPIPTFLHVSDGKMADVHALDRFIPEPGAFYVMDRAYLDFERLHALAAFGAFFVIRAKSNTRYHRRYSQPVDKTTGLRCDQTIVLTGADSTSRYPQPLRRVKYWDESTGKTFNFPDQQLRDPCAHGRRVVPAPLASGAVFQVDQAALADQVVLWDLGERRQEPTLDCGVGVRARGHPQKTAGSSGKSLHNSTDTEFDSVRENPAVTAIL